MQAEKTSTGVRESAEYLHKRNNTYLRGMNFQYGNRPPSEAKLGMSQTTNEGASLKMCGG